MRDDRLRYAAGLVLLTALALGLLLWNIGAGSVDITLGEIAGSIRAMSGIIWAIRLPRVAAAALLGGLEDVLILTHRRPDGDTIGCAVALCLAHGTSIITDSVWNTRFRYTDEFKRMGAQIQVDGNLAIIEGVEHLTGAQLEACDLRAGAAMLIAALAAHGVSEISNVQYIERGYEDVIGKVRGVGGRIKAVEIPEEEPLVSSVG